MRIVLLSGFLGSGKTSLLLPFATYLKDVSRRDTGTAVVIIENEIGSVSIDGATLRAGGLEVRELIAGCICCNLADDLSLTIQEIRELYDPEWLIIEATGLAIPSEIEAEIRSCRGLDASVSSLVVVDASRFIKLIAFNDRMIRRQLEGATTILLNKIDLVDEGTKQQIVRTLGELQPGVAIIEMAATCTIEPAVWKMLLASPVPSITR